MSNTASFDPLELRRAFGSFATGVTIVTALDLRGRPVGLTANSFSSVSLDPPLVLWSQSLAAPSHGVFREAGRFAISILAEDQAGLSDRFARGGGDKFAGVAVRAGLDGLPLIEGAAACLECARVAIYPGGDHAIFLGRVERFERHGRRPLVFAGGRYLPAAPLQAALA